jgi:hypothetical protein
MGGYVKFLLLTLRSGSKTLINMDDVSSINEKLDLHNKFEFSEVIMKKGNNDWRIKETPEQIWEMLGAMR